MGGSCAIVWDLSTGDVVESYLDAIAASWWERDSSETAGVPASEEALVERQGWLVVATPEVLQVLPSPGHQYYQENVGGFSNSAVAEGFYHLSKVNHFVLCTTGTDRNLSFAVSDGQRVNLYNLQVLS